MDCYRIRWQMNSIGIYCNSIVDIEVIWLRCTYKLSNNFYMRKDISKNISSFRLVNSHRHNWGHPSKRSANRSRKQIHGKNISQEVSSLAIMNPIFSYFFLLYYYVTLSLFYYAFITSKNFRCKLRTFWLVVHKCIKQRNAVRHTVIVVPVKGGDVVKSWRNYARILW